MDVPPAVGATSDVLCERLQRAFPFPRYFYLGLEAQAHVLETVRELLPAGGRILDIGCGPLDKTALLAWAGYDCHAVDDFTDPWHRTGENLEKIRRFAQECGIDLRIGDARELPFDDASFDLVMLNDVIEHLHETPRELLNTAVSLLKPGGLLLLTVPNAANIRKRVALLRGRTNLPPYEMYYWSEGQWRGHVREYVRDDLRQLAKYVGLDVVTLESCHHMVGVLPRATRVAYRAATSVFPGWRDSWLLVGRRPTQWKPRPAATDARDFGLDYTGNMGQDYTQ